MIYQNYLALNFFSQEIKSENLAVYQISISL